MFGLALVAGDSARTPEHDSPLGGLALDLAWWHGRFGLAAEGSALWSADSDGARALVLGVSARVRVLERMMPALMDPRDVELAVEVQAIVEREWWNVSMVETDPMAEGLGLALRVRGAGEPDGTRLLAESRFFLRVMTSRWSELDAVARAMPAAPVTSDRAFTVLVGIGASFGAGSPGYMDRFRPHPFGSLLRW